MSICGLHRNASSCSAKRCEASMTMTVLAEKQTIESGPSLHQRLLTTILVVPITLGTVLIAEGLLNYLGPQGWFNRTLIAVGLIDHPLRLVHNYWGVFASLVISGFPFTFLLVLSYVT